MYIICIPIKFIGKKMNFPLSHISSLCKYTGISFTAGAITHGFFSGERSFWTAAFGIFIFMLGGILEKIANPDKDHSWTNILVVGIFAAIGLGFFTGGLQHFPDSPGRSAWVVPVGFVMSLVAMYLMEAKGKTQVKTVIVYGVIGGVIVLGASVFALSYFNDHESDHDHNHGVPTANHSQQVREINISMDDSMKFIPENLEVKQGETIRFVVSNTGKLVHELVLGREAELKQHLIDMKKPGFQDHKHDNEVSVKPGQKGELIWTFKDAGEWQMGCLEDGHYEAGMKGKINVLPK